jgi:hypothetical protein
MMKVTSLTRFLQYRLRRSLIESNGLCQHCLGRLKV